MSAGRPLPRSLAPLPDETLPGFLLRLAHRLDISPNRVAARTGLIAPGRLIPTLFVLNIPDPTATRFAHLTRLSRSEVDKLCLSSLRDRYPPLDLDYSQRGTNGPWRKGAVPPNSAGWLFRRSSRYCPRCLKGDGSPIQTQLGGPWRKLWWLPPVFACTTHQAMLEWRCPTCGQCLNARHTNRTTVDAVIRSNLRQHPSLCRASRTAAEGSPRICGGPLPDTPHKPAPPELQALQNRILTNLHLNPDHHSDGTGHPSAAQYLNDLRLLTVLTRASWPEAIHEAPAWIDTDRLDHHHRELDDQNPKHRRDAVVFAGLPADPALCAHLLALAEHLHLTTTTGNDPGRITTLLLHAERRPSWIRLLRSIAPTCSELLQEIIAPRLQARAPRRPGRPPMNPLPRRVCSFDHRNLSHFLAKPHVQPLFDIIGDGIEARIVHRYAAVQIISITEARSLPEASALLGVPPSWGKFANASVRRWAKRHHLSEAVEHAVDHVIDRLDAEPNRIDYQRRREALREWSIPPTHWANINTALIPQLTPHSRSRFTWDERKRRTASAIVWGIVTQGDARIAPSLHSAAGRRDLDLANQVNTTQFLLKRSTVSAWTALHSLLVDYSRDLALTIDHLPRDRPPPAQ